MCDWCECVYSVLGTITQSLCICHLAIKLYCIVLYCIVLYCIVLCVWPGSTWSAMRWGDRWLQHAHDPATLLGFTDGTRPMTAAYLWTADTLRVHELEEVNDCSIRMNCQGVEFISETIEPWLQHMNELSRHGVHIWDTRTMTAAYKWIVKARSSNLGH